MPKSVAANIWKSNTRAEHTFDDQFKDAVDEHFSGENFGVSKDDISKWAEKNAVDNNSRK
jgi:hypothetical protein